jgi:KAP family P-loop domain/WD domain, G-beta repeat
MVGETCVVSSVPPDEPPLANPGVDPVSDKFGRSPETSGTVDDVASDRPVVDAGQDADEAAAGVAISLQLRAFGNPLTGHTGAVLWGAWSRVGEVPVLATGGNDGTVWLWDGRDGSVQAGPLTGHTDVVLWGAWSRVGEVPVLATGGNDGTVRLWELIAERSVPRRSAYHSDDSEGADRLNRLTEATALADLLLSRSARPPLAVGLFGEWGEGKSYFLRLLIEQVSAIANGSDVFAHHHVRQVRFNAWHYAETDLWASLVAEIFGQLARPTNERDVADEQREQSRLVAEIVADRRLPERIAAERARAQKLRESLKPARWKTLSDKQNSDLTSALRDTDPDLVKAAYRAVTAPIAWLAMIRMRAGQIWSALPSGAKRVTLLTLVLIVGIAILNAALPGLFAGVLGLIAKIVVPVGGLTWLAAVWRGAKEDIRQALDQAKTLRERVGKVVEGWQRQVQTALEVSESNVRALERELQNLTAAGQLAGFISDRVAEGGYRQTLGVMTQIREDFERMSKLLTRDRTEQASGQLAGLDQPDAGGDKVPRIDRIVLYIDDLDRCPPHRVVQVLEAVHLLLAVPLFVVVVAVDPRWLLRAVALHYREVLNSGTAGTTASAGAGFTPGGEVDPDDDEHWASTPAQYLEKIFQVVFTLPTMNTLGYTSLLDELVGPRADTDPSANPPTPASPDGGKAKAEAPANAAVTGEAFPAPDDGDGTVELPAARVVDRIDPLALDSAELTLIRLLGPPLITTPRAVKRLANSYGLLAALSRLKDPHKLADARRPAMVLLAALIGFPNLGPALLTLLHRSAIKTPRLKWTEFLKQLEPARSPDGWFNAADPRLTAIEAEAWRTLAHALDQITRSADQAGVLLPKPISDWTDSIGFVGRLAFPAGSIVARLSRARTS